MKWFVLVKCREREEFKSFHRIQFSFMRVSNEDYFEDHEFTMKRSNTWRDVDDFDFGNEEDEEEFRMIDAFAAKPKGKKRAQEQQQRSTSNGRVARHGTGSASGGRRKLEDDTMDWIARHRPTRASQLAVNQKKVDEFTEWARGRQVGTKSSFYSLAVSLAFSLLRSTYTLALPS